MPIVNDRENNKTIDTETGIYIELVNERPNEQLFMFNIIDGEYRIYIETEMLYNDKDGFTQAIYKLFPLEKKIDNKYKNIIENLLINCQEYHGMISGVPMKFDVDFASTEHMFVDSEEMDQ